MGESNAHSSVMERSLGRRAGSTPKNIPPIYVEVGTSGDIHVCSLFQ